MTARRDAKQVTFVASGGMNAAEYQTVIDAHRTMGRIEVHQQFRKLATDLGLPPDCSEIPRPPRRRRPRWITEMLDRGYEQAQKDLRTRALVGASLWRTGNRRNLTATVV